MRTQSAGAGGGNPAATNSAGAAQPASGDAQVRKVTADVNNVEAAVAEANRLSGEADKYQKAIAVITLSATKNGSPSDNLQQLQSTVEAIDNTKLISKLNDVKKPLDGSSSGSLENTRNQDCNTLSQNAANQQQDVTDLLTRCSAATSDASSALTTLSTAVSSLQEKLQTVSPYFGSQIAGLQGQLKPFSDPRFVATPPDASALLEVLSTALPPLKSVRQNQDPYKTAWNATKSALGDLSITAGTKDVSGSTAVDPDKALSDLQSAIDGITPKLDGWFKAIAAEMQSGSQALDNLMSGVLGDPGKNSAGAIAEVRK